MNESITRESLIERLKNLSANRAQLREKIEHHRQQLAVGQQNLLAIEANLALLSSIIEGPKKEPAKASVENNQPAA